jgi:hypothetical protein
VVHRWMSGASRPWSMCISTLILHGFDELHLRLARIRPHLAGPSYLPDFALGSWFFRHSVRYLWSPVWPVTSAQLGFRIRFQGLSPVCWCLIESASLGWTDVTFLFFAICYHLKRAHKPQPGFLKMGTGSCYFGSVPSLVHSAAHCGVRVFVNFA